MSKSNGQDYYLQNLPQDLNEYGLNKTLITRALSIDWKHRDTEMHLRNPLLLDKISLDFNIKKLYQNRSNQLRYIYHIGRTLLKDSDPNDLVYTFDFVRNNHFNTKLGNTFIDINCIIRDGYNINDTISNSIIFSYNHMKQQDMIKYFIAKNLPIPKQFVSISSFEELENMFSKNISFILYNEYSFSDIEKLYLWLSNYHLYQPYTDNIKNITYSRLSYKTDINLQNPIYY